MTPAPEAVPDRLGFWVGVPVSGAHSLRHLQLAASVLAGEAGLGGGSLARLQSDCAPLVRDLIRRAPAGALVLLRVVRRGSGVGLEVTAEYGPTAEEPLGGRLSAAAWEPAG